MSGGSFDYLYGKMEDGDAVAFASHATDLIAEMERTVAKIRDGEAFYYDRTEKKYVPHPRAEVAIIAIQAQIEMMRSTLRKVDEIKVALSELAPMAHAIEWCCSGDTGPDDIADTAERWLLKRIGMVTP